VVTTTGNEYQSCHGTVDTYLLTKACQSAVVVNRLVECCHSRDVTVLKQLRTSDCGTGCVMDHQMFLIRCSTAKQLETVWRTCPVDRSASI